MEPLDRLPEMYARALRLVGEGLDPATVADRLDLDPEVVGPLLRLARAKLAAATNELGGDP